MVMNGLRNGTEMSDKEILELAKTCGSYVNGDKLWMSWEEELLKFAREMYNKGRDDEAEQYVDENY